MHGREVSRHRGIGGLPYALNLSGIFESSKGGQNRPDILKRHAYGK
jgi:hypothetical protein